MKTFLINSKIRYFVHFYSQPESGKRIRFEYSGEAFGVLKEISNLPEFRLVSIQGSFTHQNPHKYNIYHECKVLDKGYDSLISGCFVLFECKHIQSGVTESEVTQILRKEKLLQIDGTT